MRNRIVPLALAVLSASGFLGAQEPPERVRVLCDQADPKNHCAPPGPDCVCIPDRLEIVLEGTDDSVLVLGDAAPGQKVRLTVYMEVKSPDTPGVDDVQGWSYGVLHDDTVLTILDATTDGTDAAKIFGGESFGLDATSHQNIVTCATSEASCPDPKPGGGFISATVLSLRRTFQLPPGRSSIAFAEYETTGKPFVETVIQFTDRLAAKGSPPALINVTVAGNSRLPETVIDGLIVREFAEEICDNLRDDDGDGLTDCIDDECCEAPNCAILCPCPDWAFYFGPRAEERDVDLRGAPDLVISMRNAKNAMGFQLGVQMLKSGARTRWEFSSFLGEDAGRLVELLIADEEGMGQAPATPNRLASDLKGIRDITRGAAIAGFSNRDFFSFDLSPGGDPGFTVGYVADTNPSPGQAGNLILSRTGPPGSCPVNEILRVSLSLPPLTGFNRGDADGNARLNVADAVLIIRVRAGILPAPFDCDDALDANDDGTADLADGIHLLNYLFRAGPALAPPFRACAGDPTADGLECAASNCG